MQIYIYREGDKERRQRKEVGNKLILGIDGVVVCIIVRIDTFSDIYIYINVYIYMQLNVKSMSMHPQTTTTTTTTTTTATTNTIN